MNSKEQQQSSTHLTQIAKANPNRKIHLTTYYMKFNYTTRDWEEVTMVANEVYPTLSITGKLK